MKYEFYLDENSINDKLRLTYIFDIKEEEIPTLEVLSSLILEGSLNFPNKREIKKNLFKNYDSQLITQVLTLGNKGSISFIIEGINKEFLPEKEDVLKKVLEMLVDIINNSHILSCNINQDKLDRVKRNLRKNYTNYEYSLENVLDEIQAKDEEYIKYVNEITLQDVITLYKRVITESKILLQVLSRENRKDLKKYVEKNLKYNKKNSTKIKLPIYDLNNVYYKKISKTETTAIMYVLQDDITRITSKRIIYLDILSDILDNYMFKEVRVKKQLSYNPSATFSISKNAIILHANILEENKNKVMEIIDGILEKIEQGIISESHFEKVKEDVCLRNNTEKMENSNIITFDLENYVLGIRPMNKSDILEITLDEIKEFAKNLKVKVVYYLGGK